MTGKSPAFDFDLPGLVEWTGLSKRYWYGKVKEIDHYVVGKRLFFRRADVEKFLETHRVVATTNT